MTAHDYLGVVKDAVRSFFKDKALRLSAALAYYAIFSIGPLLFVLILVAGAVFDEASVKEQVRHQLTSFIGPQGSTTVESMVEARKHEGNAVTMLIGIVTLIFGAGGVFGQLQDALNTIWEVQAKPGKGIITFLRNRFLSLSMVLGLGFLLLVSMVITTILEAVATSAGSYLPIPDWALATASSLLSFVVVSIFFVMVFKFLPDVKIGWRNVWVGAVGTALLFTAGKFLLSLYLGRQGTASAYGAAGSVLVVLLWVYYASVILFFGAEFTRAYTLKTGTRLKFSPYAQPISKESRAQQGTPNKKS